MAKNRLAYKEEKEESDNGGFIFAFNYPENFPILPVSEQIFALQKIPEFFKLDFGKINDLAKEQKLPKHAEGLVVVPKFTIFSEQYFEALIKIIQALKRQRDNFYDFGSLSLSFESLALEQRLLDFLVEQTEKTDGDFLVFPVQLGRSLQNKVADQAIRVLFDGEVFMDAFTAAGFLLSHKGFLDKYPCLGLECASSRVDARKSPTNLFPQMGELSKEPNFNFNLSFSLNEQNRLMFGLKWNFVSSPSLGLATIFTSR